MRLPAKSPDTIPLVSRAKPNKTKRIVTHALYALHAIFLSVHPALAGVLALMAWGFSR